MEKISVILKRMSRDVSATYDFHTRKVTVKKGSKVQNSVAPHLIGTKYETLRKKLFEIEVIVDNIFQRDFVFSSPSAASTVILGSSTNGKVEWITEDGQDLKSVLLNGISKGKVKDTELDKERINNKRESEDTLSTSKFSQSNTSFESEALFTRKLKYPMPHEDINRIMKIIQPHCHPFSRMKTQDKLDEILKSLTMDDEEKIIEKMKIAQAILIENEKSRFSKETMREIFNCVLESLPESYFLDLYEKFPI